MGKQWKQCQTLFLGAADGDHSHEIKRCLLLERKVMNDLDNILKSRHYFTNKGLSNQGYGFSSSHVWMWELDYKESWVPQNWCFWTVVLEKTLESPLDCKSSNQSILKEISPERRTDAEAETPILRPPDAKNWLTGKDPGAEKYWNREKGMTEDEMVG